MTTNNENLDLIYRRVSILEMIEKIKSCGMLWHKVAPNTYQSTYIVADDVWDLNISKNYHNGVITIDFRKNTSYFYTIDSDVDSGIKQLFEDIEGDEDFQKDRQLLRDVSGIPTCH
jgi:hypothetical protein